MSNFFLGPNFRERVEIGKIKPVNEIFLPSQTKEELAAQEEFEDTKKEVKAKGKQDGKEQGQQ
jgi:flagellar biosynthesis/type III secretory pathway protein FliH